MVQRRVVGDDGENAAAAVEVGKVADFQLRPRSVADSLGRDGIEHETARRGENEAALLGAQRLRIFVDSGEVGAVAAEALRPEVVGHTVRSDLSQSGLERGLLDLHLPNPDSEPVSLQSAARQLARMRVRLEDLKSLTLEAPPRFETDVRARHGEPLNSYRAAVLESGVSNVQRATPALPCQLACNPLGVGVTLAHLQQNVLT